MRLNIHFGSIHPPAITQATSAMEEEGEQESGWLFLHPFNPQQHKCFRRLKHRVHSRSRAEGLYRHLQAALVHYSLAGPVVS